MKTRPASTRSSPVCALLNGLRAKDPAGCGGTVDLFPEEGKYHLGGHRACRVCLTPEESMAMGNLCPACGKPLTIGVLHRVAELGRKQGTERGLPGLSPLELPSRLPYRYIVPLPELLAQQIGTASTSKKVASAYTALLVKTSPELPLLLDADTRRDGEERVRRFHHNAFGEPSQTHAHPFQSGARAGSGPHIRWRKRIGQ